MTNRKKGNALTNADVFLKQTEALKDGAPLTNLQNYIFTLSYEPDWEQKLEDVFMQYLISEEITEERENAMALYYTLKGFMQYLRRDAEKAA